MFEFPNWVHWSLGGAGVLVVLLSLWPTVKGWLPFFKPKPDPVSASVLGRRLDEAFTAIKVHCKDCPEACEALKVIWKHLEPGHHEVMTLDVPKGMSFIQPPTKGGRE